MIVFCGSLLKRVVHESEALVDFCMCDTLCILRTLAHTCPLQVLPPQWSPPRIFRLLWVASEHLSLFLLRFPPCVMFTRRRATVFVLSSDPLLLCRRPPHCHCRLRAFACRGYMVLWKAIFDKAPDLSRNDINIRTSTSDALHNVSAHHAHV